MATLPVWQDPRLDYSPPTNITQTDFERIEKNTLNLRNQAAPGNTTTGTANSYNVVIDSIDEYIDRLAVVVKFHTANTGASTLNINSIGAQDILRYDGQPLQADELVTNQYVMLIYNGAAFQAFSTTKEFTIVEYGLYGETTGTDTYTTTIASLTTPLPTGSLLNIKFNNANTGASSLSINGGAAISLKKYVSQDLEAGDIATGSVISLHHDGTNLQLLPVGSIVSDIGDLSTLTTTDKTSLTNAVNEINTQVNVPLEQSITSVDTVILLPSSTLRGQLKGQINGLTLVNSIVNGNFATTSGWPAPYGAASVANNEISIEITLINQTGNRIERNIDDAMIGSKYFVYTEIFPTQTTSSNSYIQYGDININPITPVKNKWNELYGSATATGTTRFRIYHSFVGSEYQIGDTWKARNAFIINMTALGIEDYTESQMLKLVRLGYFDGIKSTTSLELKSVGKNLISKYDLINYAEEYGASGYALLEESGLEIIELIPSDYNLYPLLTKVYKANTQYTFSVKSRMVDGNIIYFRAYYTDGSISSLCSTTSLTYEDISGTSLSGKTIEYIYISYGTGGFTSRIDLNSIQLEEGTTATDYVAYESSRNYITPPFNDGKITRVPNGSADSVDINTGIATQRNKKYLLQSGDIDTLTTSWTNHDAVRVGIDAFQGVSDWETAIEGKVLVNGFIGEVSGSGLDTANFPYYFATAPTLLYLLVPKGTYANLGEAQIDLAGTELIYQLATPVIHNLEITPLMAHGENTTIYIAPPDEDFANFVPPETTLEYATNPAAERKTNSDAINQLAKNQNNLLVEPSREFLQTEVDNLKSGILANGDVPLISIPAEDFIQGEVDNLRNNLLANGFDPYNRLFGTSSLDVTINAVSFLTSSINLGVGNGTNKKYFKLIIRGNAVGGKNKNVGVMVHALSGTSGYHYAVGSLAESSFATVTERYTTGGAWVSQGIDGLTYDLNNPLIGRTINISNRGCGVYQNEFYSSIVDSNATVGTEAYDMLLLGAYLDGDFLRLLFYNSHPTINTKMRTEVNYEIW